MIERAEAAARWSDLHHGIDPAAVPLLSGWLEAMWRLAEPLARRGVAPTALTVAGAAAAVAAVPAVGVSPALALGLVGAAVLADGLDGAIAVLAGRATPSGAWADAVADRVSDTAFALVLWRCGAPLELAAAAGALSLLHEGWRRARGGDRRARITVAERPTRTICTVLAAGSALVSRAPWPPTVCAAVWCGLGLAGLAQLEPDWFGALRRRDPSTAPHRAGGPGTSSR